MTRFGSRGSKCSFTGISEEEDDSSDEGDKIVCRMWQISPLGSSVSAIRGIFNNHLYLSSSSQITNDWYSSLSNFCKTLSNTLSHLHHKEIGTLAIHNHLPESIGNLLSILPFVDEVVISIYTPHFYDLLVSLVDVREHLSHLHRFSISNNRITGKERQPLLKLIKCLTNLRVLVLNNCGLYDSDVESICSALSWDQLQYLSMNRNKLSLRSLGSVLVAIRDRRGCAPLNLFMQDMDTGITEHSIPEILKPLREYTNSSTIYRKDSTMRGMRLLLKRTEIDNYWSILDECLYLDLARLEISDCIAPDLGLFVYEWLRMAIYFHGNVRKVVLRFNGRVTSSIKGTSSALSMYGIYMLFHRSLKELNLSIALDLTNCSFEFDVQKLRMPLDIIPFLMNRLQVNISTSLTALSLSDCDLCERWRRQDIVSLISFLQSCSQLRLLDLRYNEFNKDFNTLFCAALESTTFLPLLDILKVDMFIDLQTLATSLQNRYSGFVRQYLELSLSHVKPGIFRGPRCISCGSQSRGTKLPSALIRMLSLSESALSHERLVQLFEDTGSVFDTYPSLFRKALKDVLVSPLQSLTCKQAISANSLTKRTEVETWHYADATIGREPSAMGDTISELVHAAVQRAIRQGHPPRESYLRRIEKEMLSIQEFLALIHTDKVAAFYPNIKHLDLSSNLLSKIDAKEIIQIVSLIPSIQALNLANCSLSDRVCANILAGFSQLLSRIDLFYINISHNNLGELTADAVSHFVHDILASKDYSKRTLISLRAKNTKAFVLKPENLLSVSKSQAYQTPAFSNDNCIDEDGANMHSIRVWLIIAKENAMLFKRSDILKARSQGISILSTVTPVGKFYDHLFVDELPLLLRELNLSDVSFDWLSAENIWDHYMHNCA